MSRGTAIPTHSNAINLKRSISMTIYDIQVLSERIVKNFKPTRLYIKELAGIKYFGKSTNKNMVEKTLKRYVLVSGIMILMKYKKMR